MKRKLCSISFVLLFILPAFLFGAKPCSCGAQATGSVTSYWVGDNQDCCTGTISPNSIGLIDYYVPDEGDTYACVLPSKSRYQK